MTPRILLTLPSGRETFAETHAKFRGLHPRLPSFEPPAHQDAQASWSRDILTSPSPHGSMRGTFMSDTAANTIACLGPEGSFSHLITQMRFPDVTVSLRDNIGDVFDFLSSRPDALGIVPIENSSGGFIIDTVDRLLDARCQLSIVEELTLDVKLALLGRPGEEVRTIHSHAMPFFHGDDWLKAHYPHAKRIVEPSTAKAAEKAAATPGAAAIGPRQNAERHALSILHFPIAGEVPNITQFFLLGHTANSPDTTHNRTALVVELPDRPGSLCRFLTPLSEGSINLKRLESRPIRGQPNKYRFYIEIEGSTADPHVQAALAQTHADGATTRRIGSYCSGTRFES